MTTSVENMKLVMDYFGLNNKGLALALGLDPSQVSRWLNGKRRLIAASPQADALAEYILSRSASVKDMEWLKEQLKKAGLSADLSSVYRTKQNLILWLASDSAELRRNLGSAAATAVKPAPEAREEAPARISNGEVSIGSLSIALALEPVMCGVPARGTVDIFLSSDRIATMRGGDISAIIQEAAERNKLTIRMMVCVSGDTQAMSRLIEAYISAIISGRVQLYIVHGITQTVTNQLHIIVPARAAMLVTEAPFGLAPAVATFVTDADFVRETQKSFDATFRYAQPILTVYGDQYTRNILEILYMEYCLPGALDVVKDSVNPMYMSPEAYDRFLSTRGHNAEEYGWRSAEFIRFKRGNEAVLESGAVFREVIPLTRLHQIIQGGYCRMPGLYFMELGYVNVDAQGCVDILNGYIHHIETYPNFHLLILDDIEPLHENNCWHIKVGQSLAINEWNGDVPVMIHSDHNTLLREFQSHYDKLWSRGAGCVGNRNNVISMLRDVVRQLSFNE